MNGCFRLVLLLCLSDQPCDKHHPESAVSINPTKFVTQLPNACAIEGNLVIARLGHLDSAYWITYCERTDTNRCNP